ncbi:MAG: hypothetical protein K8W52_35775 [Deltaproteobacteria bacterium]|nr:hypothetical protein [Deltaproteobacteria bacterium]
MSPGPLARTLAWIDRHATPRRARALAALAIVVLAVENLLDFPLSVPFMQRTTGHTYLDMCAFCSRAQIEAHLDGFGTAGRGLQLWLLPTVDVIIPFVGAAFGSVALAVLVRDRDRRWRVVRLLPLVALALDLVENAAIAALVIAHPHRLPIVAAVSGAVTGLKFLAYASTIVVAAALSLVPARRAASARS